MGRMLIVAAVLMSLGAAAPALADRHGGAPRISAADFLDLCQASAAAPRNACGGLLVNIMEVHVLLGSKDRSMRLICPPRRLGADQARFLFNGWAQKRRDLADLEVMDAINRALLESFPCGAAPEVKK